MRGRSRPHREHTQRNPLKWQNSCVATPEAVDRELLDRQQELTALEGAVDAAQEGTGALLVLEGGAGIGKTRLLDSAVKLAADRGTRVLRAVGGELERELPFGVVRQLFEAVLARSDERDRERLLEGAAELALPAVDPTADPTEAPASFSTLHGLYWLTANLAAEQPLVLAVDDAHWSDTASLRFLAYLARRLEGIPVLLIVTVRTGEPGSETELLEAISGADQATVLRPGPLSEGSLATLIEEGLGEKPVPEFTRACLAATGGNPFLARELIQEMAERGVPPVEAEAAGVTEMAPERVARMVLTRLGRLPEGSQELARAVAVLGEGADVATAAEVAEIPPERAKELVDALTSAGLLERGTPLRFAHPLVRSAVAGALQPGELHSIHRQAAAVLDGAGDRGDRVAAHLASTEPSGDDWVVEKLVAAAQRATARGAPEAAAPYLERALAEPPSDERRQGVLLGLGVAEVRSGDPGSIEHLERALEESPDPARRAGAALALGRALSAFGRFTDAVPVYERGLSDLGDADPELKLELEADLLGAAPLGLSTRTISVERMNQVAEGLKSDSPAACKLLACLAREKMAQLGSRAECVELARRSLSGEYSIAEEPMLSFPYAPLVLMFAGQLDEAVSVYDDALTHSRKRGAVLDTALLLALRTLAVHRQGRLTEAATDAREALDIADANGAAPIAAYAGGFLVWTLIAQGELDEAEQLLDRLAGRAEADAFSGITALLTRGQLRIAQGRPKDAVTELRECGRRLEAWQVFNPGVASWRGELAQAERLLGNHVEAERLASEQLELAREWGAPHLLAQSLRTAGEAGNEEKSEERLQGAIEVAEDGGIRLEQARALLALGSLWRRRGSRKESRDPLRHALDLGLTCGAPPVAERAHEELVASGAQPRRLRESGPDALTPAERRVAGMAAEGMTNRGIAQALFVSEKTVETHLRAVFRKLDIGSRSQLAGKLEPATAP